MQFNIKKYRTLVKNKKMLGSLNNAKLEIYNYLLDDYFLWQNKENFYQLIQLFLTKKITIEEFLSKFRVLNVSSLRKSRIFQKNFQKDAQTNLNEIEIEINPNSKGFEEIISYLDDILNLYEPNITLEMNLENPELIGYGISEEFIRDLLKDKFLIEIKTYRKKH